MKKVIKGEENHLLAEVDLLHKNLRLHHRLKTINKTKKTTKVQVEVASILRNLVESNNLSLHSLKSLIHKYIKIFKLIESFYC